MTVQQVLDYVDEVKPNAFSPETKVLWLNGLEGRIAAEVFLFSEGDIAQTWLEWPDCREDELLVPHPFEDIYFLWLQAKVDEANGEYDKFQNTMQIYNAHYGSFVRWVAEVYDPAHRDILEEV